MRILSVCVHKYRNSRAAVEPIRLYFTLPLETLGHTVETFDHFETSRSLGTGRATETLLDKISRGRFDAVFYQSFGRWQPIDVTALDDLSRRVPILCWNSDDDWQWEHWTHKLAPHFTYVITTYPQVFEQYKPSTPNLLLSQWGCLGNFSGFERAKDIPLSFAGAVYKIRNSDCRWLRRNAGLKAYGQGARLVNLGVPYFKGAFRVPLLSGKAIDFRQVNDIWNRTRVSYAPLRGGQSGEVLSLKSRIFDMGCSGTLMLCEHAPSLERYFEPGKECITFSNLQDCAEKAKYYLAHEDERLRIAMAYRRRTCAEHMWTHRFEEIFRTAGIGSRPLM